MNIHEAKRDEMLNTGLLSSGLDLQGAVCMFYGTEICRNLTNREVFLIEIEVWDKKGKSKNIICKAANGHGITKRKGSEIYKAF